MEEQSFFDRMITHLRSSCKYYTGYPKDFGPSRVIHFTSEREFVQLLHKAVLLLLHSLLGGTIQSILTKYWRKLLLNSIQMLNLCA
ncbi:putative phytol kinase 3 [Hibiscus syriacus]|uniref:Phytol kinase 3 n=1 Tax=Hibiscus syriacus TaxID=106335 RepID=A0A6A3D1N2_HIBSY|nr:putative phytol kinase 3 [Hibiscus syriacus]